MLQTNGCFKCHCMVFWFICVLYYICVLIPTMDTSVDSLLTLVSDTWYTWEFRCLSNMLASLPLALYPVVGLLDHMGALF